MLAAQLSGSADIQLPESGVQIKLKTGAVTDANLGVGAIAWAMGDKSGNKELNAIMDGPELNVYFLLARALSLPAFPEVHTAMVAILSGGRR